MKGWLKLLVLGAVPILAVTMVADQALAADKGSQLIFQSNMAHQSFISVTNANDGRAVTVLVQYYNDEMSLVLYYLRVIPGGGNVLVDPFNHEIPGSAEEDADGMEIEGTATNVSDVIGTLPAMTNDDDGAGVNSGRFVITVTAVGANLGVDANGDGTIADFVSREDSTSTTTPKAELADTIAVSVGGYYIQDGAAMLIRREATSDADGNITGITLRDPRALEPTDGTDQPDDIFRTSVETNRSPMVNVLFPSYLAAGMHGVDNIDNGGTFRLLGGNNLGYTKSNATPTSPEDTTSKNVGDLNVGNAIPIAFNHLTGHFTEALTSTASGGADQTASWGGTPIVRPSVSNTGNAMMSVRQIVDALDSEANEQTNDVVSMVGDDYHALNGMDSMVHFAVSGRGPEPVGADGADVTVTLTSANTNSIIVSDLRVGDDPDGADAAGTEIPAITDAAALMAITHSNQAVRGLFGGRLAEKDAGGGEMGNVVTKQEGATGAMNRGLMGGALVLPALHGGGAETKQIMLFLSAADNFGGAGGYKLMAAKTKYSVTVHDNMGDVLTDPADDRVFGGPGGPEIASTSIIVEGISVMADAGDCGGDMIDGPWTVDHLTGLVPTASSGSGKFAGLDAMLDPAKNATPGFIKFMRAGLKCVMDYGDGSPNLVDGNDVPTLDKRTFEGGTLIVEKAKTDRAFVTTGQALLKFLTANSTFAASWSLKSPPSPMD